MSAFLNIPMAGLLSYAKDVLLIRGQHRLYRFVEITIALRDEHNKLAAEDSKRKNNGK